MSPAFLPNGNLVVTDPGYDEGANQDVGAVYLYNGQTRALISVIKGVTPGDFVGNGGITVLTNGNFVISSPNWINGAVFDAGAATWASGTTGVKGTISSGNSLVGTDEGNSVGNRVVALSNGNYVVGSSLWDNGATANVGAITWADGTTGIKGTISAANSLLGSTSGDQLGSAGITALSNGNYVVRSPLWDNGATTDAGAITWGNGTASITGAVTVTNSRFGSSTGDLVSHSLTLLSDGNYLLRSNTYDNGGNASAGMIALGPANARLLGRISAGNSVLGTAASGGSSMVSSYDATRHRLAVGRPADNIVTIFALDTHSYLPLLRR